MCVIYICIHGIYVYVLIRTSYDSDYIYVSAVGQYIHRRVLDGFYWYI